MLFTVVSALEHHRCLRTSQASPLFYLITVILDIARIRTFVLVGYHHREKVFFAAFLISFGARVILFGLENVTKRSLLINQEAKDKLSSETTANFLSRYTLWWYLDILKRGKRSTLKLSDLGGSHRNQTSAQLYDRFEKEWARRNPQSRFPLIRALISAFGQDLLGPILPSLLWCGFAALSPLLLYELLTFLRCVKFLLPINFDSSVDAAMKIKLHPSATG